MKLVCLVLLLVALGPSCGGDKGARRGEGGPQFAMRRKTPPPRPVDPYASMTVTNEVGVVDSADVEATIQDHFDEVRGCYARAGKAQKYAGGKVLLRFLIGGDGATQDVLVLESSLGNYDVERCLVEVGRRIHFNAPVGNKATTFEYPIEFRSTTGAEILDIDGPRVNHDVAMLLPQLAACGRIADSDVNAIVYIEPSGLAGSVGLAGTAALDEDAGDCVVQTIRSWRMSIALPGRVVRTTFPIPPAVATAEPFHRPHHRRHP